MSVPTIFVKNCFALEPLQEKERVRLSIDPLCEIPPNANPMQYDSVSMGTTLVNAWEALFQSTAPNKHLDLYNTATGQAFRVHIEPEEPRLRKVIDVGYYFREDPPGRERSPHKVFRNDYLYYPVIEDSLLVSFHDSMAHQSATGVKLRTEEMYVCVESRVLVSGDLILHGTPEQIEALVSETVLDDEKLAAILQHVFNLQAYVNRRGSENADLSGCASEDGAVDA